MRNRLKADFFIIIKDLNKPDYYPLMTLLNDIKKLEKLATCSKLHRWFSNPYKYFKAQLFRHFAYRITKKEAIVETKLFFNKKMFIGLPSSTDIYLTGGKSHQSEINLAKWLIQNLKTGNHFLDIGAHYGYFSLLALELVGNAGRVISFEPSCKGFDVLSMNAKNKEHFIVYHKAVCDKVDTISFYEFPNLFSEYNSMQIAQYENENWFRNSQPVKTTVETTTIDRIVNDNFLPHIIKVDVEGAEFKVVNGGLSFLKINSPIFIMEYVTRSRDNREHRKALALLKEIGYSSFIIESNGALQPIDDVDYYLTVNNLESDNIVFKKHD